MPIIATIKHETNVEWNFMSQKMGKNEQTGIRSGTEAESQWETETIEPLAVLFYLGSHEGCYDLIN